VILPPVPRRGRQYRNFSLELDERSANGPFCGGGTSSNPKASRRESASPIPIDPGLSRLHQRFLYDFGGTLRACLAVQIAKNRAGVQGVRHHLSFRRACFSAAESEDPRANRPRVLPISSSETGCRTIRESSSVPEIQVPGSIPREARISTGITHCPLVLTVVIRPDMAYT
jgi:hypothetical protein